MVDSMRITKVTARDRVVVDVEVWMQDADEHDFRPRASLKGSTLGLRNADEDEPSTTIDLDDGALMAAERDRSVELRVKFGVRGMHEVLVHKTQNTRIGPKAKKLAQSRWKTLLPLTIL